MDLFGLLHIDHRKRDDDINDAHGHTHNTPDMIEGLALPVVIWSVTHNGTEFLGTVKVPAKI